MPIGLRAFVAMLAAISVATVGVGWAAGSVGAPAYESFDWDVAGVASTAFATICLVLVTGILAYFTARLAASTAGDVSATRELAQIARVEHDRATVPNVLVAGYEVETTEQDMLSGRAAAWGLTISTDRPSVRLANVGRGAAVEVRAQLEFRYLDGTSTPLGQVDIDVILSGDVVAKRVRFPEGTAVPRERDGKVVVIDGAYRDIDGAMYQLPTAPVRA